MKFQDLMKRWFKFRFAIMYPFIVWCVIKDYPSYESFIVGTPIVAIGVLIRVWSNLYVIKNEALSTSGPYAFVRHPLYVGTALIVAGFVITMRTSYVGLIALFVMLAVYCLTIKKEEANLAKKFGDSFEQYKKQVHAFIPRFTPYASGSKWPMSWERLIRSQEYKVVLWVIICMYLAYIKEEIIVEQEAMTLLRWSIIGVFCMLASLDLWFAAARFRKRYFMHKHNDHTIS